MASQASTSPAAVLPATKEEQFHETLCFCMECNQCLEALREPQVQAQTHQPWLASVPMWSASALPISQAPTFHGCMPSLSHTPSSTPESVTWLTPNDLLSPRFLFFRRDVAQQKAAVLAKCWAYLNSANPFEEEIKAAHEGIYSCSSECLKAEKEYHASQHQERLASAPMFAPPGFELQFPLPDQQAPELQFLDLNQQAPEVPFLPFIPQEFVPFDQQAPELQFPLVDQQAPEVPFLPFDVQEFEPFDPQAPDPEFSLIDPFLLQ